MKKNKNTVLRPHQTNKEFVEAAQIAEQDAFIAVVIRWIVGSTLEIPVRELVADMTFETAMRCSGFYTDWDEGEFTIELEEIFNINIENETVHEAAEKAGYPNWFYNPDCPAPVFPNIFRFLWKRFTSKPPAKKITFGEWVKLVVEKILAPYRSQINPPTDWQGIEASDLESDAVVLKSFVHDSQFFAFWVCWTVFVAIVVLYAIAIFIIKHLSP
ncbi:MAG: hypothetical protein LBU34_08965 [Planctomycetaceae bacterium]|jgi:hypothetical protein|nr:hypothetical protein [Planctomycetaceae bacterium]